MAPLEICDDGDPRTSESCNPLTGMCETQPGGGRIHPRTQIGNHSTIQGDFGANDAGGSLKLGRGSFMSDGTNLQADSVRLGQVVRGRASVRQPLRRHLAHQQSGTIGCSPIGSPSGAFLDPID